MDNYKKSKWIDVCSSYIVLTNYTCGLINGESSFADGISEVINTKRERPLKRWNDYKKAGFYFAKAALAISEIDYDSGHYAGMRGETPDETWTSVKRMGFEKGRESVKRFLEIMRTDSSKEND